jgi:hypothetical protein
MSITNYLTSEGEDGNTPSADTWFDRWKYSRNLI